MIWEKLLTDSDGQYSEVQSGRLLNQSIGTSYRTPFKHGALSPLCHERVERTVVSGTRHGRYSLCDR